MGTEPNFFLIGAPKCGTTSVAAWLSEHPQIVMSRPKEPLFFNTDMKWHGVDNLNEYLALFRNAGEKSRAIGEASAFYLFSEDAVRNIVAFQPRARFVVMLRNPLEVARSLHAQFRYDDMEPIDDFESAWRASPSRRPVGLRCSEPKILEYRNVVSFGKQVARLLRDVSPANIAFVFMEDIRRNAQHEYERILAFLGLKSDGRVTFPVHNQSKMYRSKWLNHGRTLIARSCRNWFPAPLRVQLLALNSQAYKPQNLRPEFERELCEELRGDVALLSRLVDRDLSHWLSARDGAPSLNAISIGRLAPAYSA